MMTTCLWTEMAQEFLLGLVTGMAQSQDVGKPKPIMGLEVLK